MAGRGRSNDLTLKLHSVPTDLPEPPYPDDIKANGWKPECDIDRIRSSDTWVLAEDDEHPWLLRIWLEAWSSVPAGSMPSDLKLFARRIRCSEKFLKAHQDILLRGWTLHSDGRLYHQFIASQVLSMLDTRRKSSEKVKAWRDKKLEEKQGKDGECNRLPTSNQPVSNRQEQEQEQEQEIILVPPNGGTRPQKSISGEHSAEYAKIPPCPHKTIIEMYHRLMPRNPRVRTWEGQRPGNLRARWKTQPDLEWWEGFLAYCSESRFLTGQAESKNGSPPFIADLEWIVRPSNFQKINEGKYHR